MIIDCHCHAGTGDGLTGPWDTRAPLQKYLQRAREAGIDHTVLFAAFHSDYRSANREVASIVARNVRRFSGFAFVHALRDAGRVEGMLRELVFGAGFCGIKVHRHDARVSREICEAARKLSLPVLYDVMGELSVVDLLATEYPDVDFIIPHLGSYADDWRAQRACLDPLSRYPNVFADTAGVRNFDLIEEAVQRAGAHKVLFGTDGPWLHPGVELAKIRALKLNPSAEALVLGDNWLRLTARARGRRGRNRPPSTARITRPLVLLPRAGPVAALQFSAAVRGR
jgi:predicted TIM-barrel fold metal-dependent hydrolase